MTDTPPIDATGDPAIQILFLSTEHRAVLAFAAHLDHTIDDGTVKITVEPDGSDLVVRAAAQITPEDVETYTVEVAETANGFRADLALRDGNGTRYVTETGTDIGDLAALTAQDIVAHFTEVRAEWGDDVEPEAPAPAVFEVGKQYQARSAGDYDCVWTFTVVARTAKFITITEANGVIRRVGVLTGERFGAEWARPLGTYSLCPVINASRPVA